MTQILTHIYILCPILRTLDRILDSKNIRFALSNVIFHKDREHHILKEWLEKHQKFKVHYLDFHYKNCNYQTKKAESSEVLVTNY